MLWKRFYKRSHFKSKQLFRDYLKSNTHLGIMIMCWFNDILILYGIKNYLLILDGVDLVLDSSDEFDCMGLHGESPNFNCVSSYDISSSSLIKSPLVSELLISHGLLENGHVEDRTFCNSDSESKVILIEIQIFSYSDYFVPFYIKYNY